MPMHSPAPVSRPFPFTPAESAAAAWACACVSLLLGRGTADGDPEAVSFGAMLPDLPGAVQALRRGHLTGQDAAAVSTALVALCQAREVMPAETWAALLPPLSDVLDSARVKALALNPGPTLRRVSA